MYTFQKADRSEPFVIMIRVAPPGWASRNALRVCGVCVVCVWCVCGVGECGDVCAGDGGGEVGSSKV